MREISRDWTDVLASVTKIILKAGELAQLVRVEGLERQRKSHQDFVTAADLKVEAYVRDCLATLFPNDHVFGEEQTEGQPGGNGASREGESVIWILDPVDGTSNFAAGLDMWCLSLGAVHKGETVLGVIYAPDRRELYTAVRGEGAVLNGKPLSVSQDVPPEQALIMTGRGAILPAEQYLTVLRRLMEAGYEYRRYGSGALGIAMVATGTIQGYIETGMWPWDVAAARLIVTEAGGYISPFPLSPAKREPGPPLVACQQGLEDSLHSVLTG